MKERLRTSSIWRTLLGRRVPFGPMARRSIGQIRMEEVYGFEKEKEKFKGLPWRSDVDGDELWSNRVKLYL